MERQTVTLAIADGVKGDVLFIDMGNHWVRLSGEQYKRKETKIKERFEVDLVTLQARLNDHLKEVK